MFDIIGNHRPRSCARPGGSFDRGAAMLELVDHLASGAVTPVLGQRFDLEEASDALRMLAEGTTGRIVLVP